MKRSTIAAIATAAVLAVGGGTAYAITSAPEPAPVETSVSAPTDSPTPDATPTGDATEPVVAESPAPPVAATDPEAAYLIEVHARLARIQTQIPDVTDEQLITLAHTACDRMAAGISGENWSGIEGETKTNGYYMDSGAIAIAAAMTLCPSDD